MIMTQPGCFLLLKLYNSMKLAAISIVLHASPISVMGLECMNYLISSSL